MFIGLQLFKKNGGPPFCVEKRVSIFQKEWSHRKTETVIRDLYFKIVWCKADYFHIYWWKFIAFLLIFRFSSIAFASFLCLSFLPLLSREKYLFTCLSFYISLPPLSCICSSTNSKSVPSFLSLFYGFIFFGLIWFLSFVLFCFSFTSSKFFTKSPSSLGCSVVLSFVVLFHTDSFNDRSSSLQSLMKTSLEWFQK